MSKETEILHRISQARNKRNAPGTDEVLKDCDKMIRDYGDLVDSHCTKNIDELHTQIADMATKLTVAEDQIAKLKKPKRTRRTKAQMAKARPNEQSAKNSEKTESQPLH